MATYDLSPIQLIADRAISEPGNDRQDSLGFESYAKIISRAIKGTRGPFTIGVFGEWGMGKTSLMRMIENQVECDEEGSVVIPVWFNAWMFEQVEYPIIPLIKVVKDEIRSRERKLTNLGLAAGNLIDTLDALTSALKLKGKLGAPGSTINAELEVSPNAFKKRFAALRRKRKYGLDHDPYIYENIFNALGKVGSESVPKGITIVVLIDDLDRCFPENAVKLLEGIKLVLSQPGFIYVLGASRIVIEEYLQNKYEKEYGIAHFDGRAYLDKMIQLSFDIPPHDERVSSFTAKIIEDLDNKSLKKELLSLSSLIGEVCHHNPRSIIRFINRLIADSSIHNELNPSENIPIRFFAVTRGLQQSWRDFYGLLISGEVIEDRRYCRFMSAWSHQNFLDWKAYDSSTIKGKAMADAATHNSLDPDVLQQLALQIVNDRNLRMLMESETGKEWLKKHALREATVSFLIAHSSNEDEEATKEPPMVFTDYSQEDMFRQAVSVVVEAGRASTSLLQRRLRIGYGRAARLIEDMESRGIVSPADGSKPREVLVDRLEDISTNFRPK